jgi:hypothetical protein
MATKKKTAKKKTPDKTRRGSPEAVAKRRAARALNSLFEKGASVEVVDKRKAKRMERLLHELKNGRRGKALKPIDMLSHANSLLVDFGLTTGALRRVRSKRSAPTDPAALALYQETQATYGFDPRAWIVLLNAPLGTT